MKYEYVIFDEIAKAKNRTHTSFHMPGHKGKSEFKPLSPIMGMDITELSYSDNLLCPTGIIAKAQCDLAEICGAVSSYITTDGSTSGIMSLLYVASKRGNKLIVPRNSHKSVFNACRILRIEPVIVQGAEVDGVLTHPDPELIERLMVNDRNIAGVLITSPDYFGNIAPLEGYKKVTKKLNRLLLVDGAHGGHLALCKEKGYAGLYADLWIDGAHKSLPTMTQGAVVHLGKATLRQDLEEALSIFRTTSPNYLIMASVEYGVKYYVNNPKLWAKGEAVMQSLKESLSALPQYPSQDPTKLLLDFKPLDIDPALVLEQLEKKNIYVEMATERYLMLYLSHSTEQADCNQLCSALFAIVNNKRFRGTYVGRGTIPYNERTYSYLYSFHQPTEMIPLMESEGRMVAENIGITPPCTPILIAGELVTKQAIDLLSQSAQTFGIYDGKIKVVKA